MAGSTTITLDHPFTHDGTEYASLTMRRPRVRDDKDARRGGGSDADVELRLFGNLCEVAPAALEEMDLADYAGLQLAFRGFFPPARRPK